MPGDAPDSPDVPEAADAADALDASDAPGDDGEAPDFDDVDADVTVAEEPTACTYTDYSSGPAVEDLPATGDAAEGIEREVWDALYGIDDPEMPISIVDLGLIYGVAVDGGRAAVSMTLTYTGCPARQLLLSEVEEAVAGVEEVESVDLELVWSPPWSVEMVTEAGRADLREFGVSI